MKVNGNYQRLCFTVHQTSVELIEATEIHGGEDIVVWAPSKGGDFTLRDTYEAMRVKKAPWQWASLIWFSVNIPRHAFVAWMALRKCMKTLHRLREWGVVDSELCVHCWDFTETEDHLFWDCNFAK